jgi:hypothetical protein
MLIFSYLTCKRRPEEEGGFGNMRRPEGFILVMGPFISRESPVSRSKVKETPESKEVRETMARIRAVKAALGFPDNMSVRHSS